MKPVCFPYCRTLLRAKYNFFSLLWLLKQSNSSTHCRYWWQTIQGSESWIQRPWKNLEGGPSVEIKLLNHITLVWVYITLVYLNPKFCLKSHTGLYFRQMVLSHTLALPTHCGWCTIYTNSESQDWSQKLLIVSYFKFLNFFAYLPMQNHCFDCYKLLLGLLQVEID